jgi:DNA invertase Pin-like site-specific DNA recombinase
MAYERLPGILRRATLRPAIVLIRQSTHVQAVNNLGSGRHQRSLTELATQLGWPDDLIETVDARGESGSRGPRELFHHVLDRVKAGAVGAVLVARNDRLGRDALRSEELVTAAAQHGTLIIVEGRIYDPANSADKLMLGMMNQFAEYENRARTAWMLATRFALARAGGHRIILPTGLIWGSPDDPAFVAKLAEAGLDGWLGRLSEHNAESMRKGSRYYVMPFPDLQVYEACRVRMEVMLQQGEIDAVIDAIRTHPEYPRPGMIPTTHAISRYHPGIQVKWLSIDLPQARSILRKWFTSPALYGTYAFTSLGLMKETQSEVEDDFKIRITRAFPSFAEPEDEARIRRVAKSDSKPWRMGRYQGPRPHLMKKLRCGHRDASGSRCGRGLYAMYQPDGSYAYYSHACRYTDHPTQHVRGGPVEHVIERTILEVLDQARLRAFMESIQIDETAGQDRVRGLTRELRELDREVEGLVRSVVQAELDDATERKILFNSHLDEVMAKRASVLRRLEKAQSELKQLRSLAAADRQRLLDLGSNVARLIQLTRQNNPKALRMLTSHLVHAVYFDRLNSYVCKLEIVFPGGHIEQRDLVTRRMFVTRAAAEYAAGELARGIDPAAIADTLNLARPKDNRAPWDAERVQAAPYMLEQKTFPELRPGRHTPIRELAAIHGVPWEALFIPVIHGHLGPAHYVGDDLVVAPEPAELHRWVPEIGRAAAAAELNCKPEDLISRSDASAATGQSRGAVVGYARRRSGLGQDASGRHWVFRRDFRSRQRRG